MLWTMLRAIDVDFPRTANTADTYNIGGFNEWTNIDLDKSNH